MRLLRKSTTTVEHRWLVALETNPYIKGLSIDNLVLHLHLYVIVSSTILDKTLGRPLGHNLA